MCKFLIILLTQLFLLAKVNSYDIKTNSIENVENTVTEYNKVSNYDNSNKLLSQPEIKQAAELNESQARGINNMITQNQIRSNQIGTGLQQLANRNPFDHLVRNFWQNFGDINQRGRGFITRPRASNSFDSGGHSSNSISSEIAKLFDIKQGYYADIYDKIDRPNITTKKPADALEEKVRAAVQRFFAKRFRHHKQNKIAYN